MAWVKLTDEIKHFLDSQLMSENPPSYPEIIRSIAQRFAVQISKATISNRAKTLNLTLPRGRKSLALKGEKPPHSIALDCAGGFFLKGADIELGLLSTINRLFQTKSGSIQAQKTLRLARDINALLLYASLFDLKTSREIAAYQRRGLLYLAGLKSLPSQEEIEQYLRYLVEQKLLLTINKEVTELCTEALLIYFDFAGKTFCLDAQARTIWPNPKIPRCFSTTINKAKSYINNTILSPSIHYPLILQTAPGYTFLPPEMFNFMQSFEQAQKRPISQIAITGRFGENLAVWQDLKLPGRCYFIFPLTPWQYARLKGLQILQDFQRCQIGPDKEVMSVADAETTLTEPQLNVNIKVRAVLVKRKEQRLALITNISAHEERYARKIVEQYFSRWPDTQIKTYYDLMEQAYEEKPKYISGHQGITPLLTMSYRQTPLDSFRVFAERLHRYAQSHYFPPEYETDSFSSMCEKFYQQSGYLKIARKNWEIFLAPFAQKDLQKSFQIACHKFNQSGLKLPIRRTLHIYLQ